MSQSSYGLQQIKKELQHLSTTQVADLCVRLARYKKENKELLAYLMFQAHDEQSYLQEAKEENDTLFHQLPSHSYNAAKALRKILKLNNKYSKFAASKTFELELTIHFCDKYLEHVDRRTGYKPLRMLFIRQIQKAVTLLGKLPEDLQYDYRDEFNSLLTSADQVLSWFNKNNF
ncbi:hypothetical protein GCM10027037_08300 [Mucilaginibacter koreensis]